MQKLNTIFNISYGTKLDKNKTIECYDKPVLFVSRTSKNHGIDLICNEQINLTPNNSETITVPLGGEGRLMANVQFAKYYNGQNVAILTPINQNMTLNERIYYSLIIRKNQFKYSAFGREANSTIGDILVPSLNEIPQYVNCNYDINTESKTIMSNDILNANYENMYIRDLFDVLAGSSISEEFAKKCNKGEISFVTASRFNNGVKAKIKLMGMEATIYPKCCLTLAKNGSVGVCFYHENRIATTSDVMVLKFKEKDLNKYEGLYFKVLIEKHIFRYNYGRKINKERFDNMYIQVPVKNNSIDYEYINNFMKSIQFSDLI